MTLVEYDLKQQVEKELETLPPGRWREVLAFICFLKDRSGREGGIRTLPASHLDQLTGLVAWGGDALADTERLYDESL